MVDDLLAAVETARASKAVHERDHQRVKELLIQVRREKGEAIGPGDLEDLIGKYMTRDTISRVTSPAFGNKPPRKRTRRPPRS